MPGRDYGPGGKWIHDRAHRIMESSPDTPKSVAYATATQQAHKVGKSPKGFRTAEGVREAKKKFSLPKKEYQKTAADLSDAFKRFMLLSPVAGGVTGAGVGALAAGEGRRAQGALRGGLAGAVGGAGAPIGAAQIQRLKGLPFLVSPLVGGALAGGAAGLTARQKEPEQEKIGSISLDAFFDELERIQ